MPSVKELKFESSIQCYVDVAIEKELFTPFSDKVRNQIIASVKVDGFRPGKAPIEKAMQHIDPQNMYQTIMQETVRRFLPESAKLASEKVQSESRYALEFEPSLADSSLGIQDDGSFVLRIRVKLLPQIDFEPLKKITPPHISLEELYPDRITQEDFIAQESKKMLDSINETRTKKNQPLFETLADAISNDEENKNIFKSEEEYISNLTNIYAYESEYLKSNARQRQYINYALELVPDFDIPTSLTHPEAERITQNMVEDSEKTGLSLNDIFNQAGIPNYNNTEITDKDALQKVITLYVTNEYKLMFILRGIYELHVEPKLENSRIEQIAAEMKKSPQEYRVPSNQSDDVYQNLAFDRLMRDASIKQINRWATHNAESKSITSEVSHNTDTKDTKKTKSKKTTPQKEKSEK